MKRFIHVLMLFLASFNALAASNSNPGLYYGQVPTAAQWNSYFSSKLDYAPGAANSIPYWDASGNLLSAVVSGSCTSTAGVFNCATSNLTGGALGSLPYQTSGTTTGYLAGNTSTTPNFYTSTGTGAAAQAPTLTSSTGSGSVVLATAPTISNLNATGTLTGSGFSNAFGNPSDNAIINGSMAVAQVATSGTLTAGGSTTATTYTVDMHHAWSTGANVAWAQVTGSQGFNKAIQYTGAASVTGIGHGYRIESVNGARFAGNTITNTVWMSNSLLTSVTWTAYYVNSADAFGTNGSGAKTQIATGTITLTAADTTLRPYSVSFSAGTNTVNGMTIEYTVGAQTSGTWVITGEDLVNGSLTRPYPNQTYDKTLAQCQRYLPALSGLGPVAEGGFYSTSQAQVAYKFKVTPRIPPTGVSLSSAAHFALDNAGGVITSTVTAVAFSSASLDQANINITGTATPYTAQQPATLKATSTSAQILFTGARL